MNRLPIALALAAGACLPALDEARTQMTTPSPSTSPAQSQAHHPYVGM